LRAAVTSGEKFHASLDVYRGRCFGTRCQNLL